MGCDRLGISDANCIVTALLQGVIEYLFGGKIVVVGISHQTAMKFDEMMYKDL